MRKDLFIIILLLAAAIPAYSQEVDVRPSAVTAIPMKQAKEHSPTKALLLSVIPGGGQIYNGQAWKLPIFYAALGVMGYLVYDSYTDMKMFKNEYLRIGPSGSSSLEEYPNYPGSSIYNMYQTSNKSFQQYVLITAAVYGFNLLDAYVFGHLYDFQVSDDLSLNVVPALTPNCTVAPTLNLTFRF